MAVIDVDDAFEGVRKQGDGAGNLIGDIFQDDDSKSDGDIYAGNRADLALVVA